MVKLNETATGAAGGTGSTETVRTPVPRFDTETLIRTASMRDAERLAALQSELRVMGELRMMSELAVAATGAAIPTELGREAAARNVTISAAPDAAALPQAIVRADQDARFSQEQERVQQLLGHFSGGLQRSALNTPRTLVVVAHPDDETIGAGVQLARFRDATVLHITDGVPTTKWSAQRHGFATAEEYGDTRRREAAAALRLAGVADERQLCMGIPDGDAPFHLVEISLALAELIDELKPEVLLTHPYEGGHTDHDAISFAVQLACGILRREGTPTPAILELTSYHNRNGRRAVHSFLPQPETKAARTLRLTPAARELKTRMYECFESQRACVAQFSTAVERFRPAPRYIYTRPPHEGLLDYERLSRRMTGAEWRRHAQRALSHLRSGSRARVSLAQPRSSTTSLSQSTTFLEA